MNLIIPRPILTYIDKSRGRLSRESYLLKCVDFVIKNNIYITNENNDDKYEEFNKGRED